MKREILGFSLAALLILGVGVLAGRNIYPHKCTRKHQNVIPDGRIVIIPVDTVDGRPTYNILLSDETGVDSMYPEEIGNSLKTGKWEYNEMLEIKEKP